MHLNFLEHPKKGVDLEETCKKVLGSKLADVDLTGLSTCNKNRKVYSQANPARFPIVHINELLTAEEKTALQQATGANFSLGH